LKRAQISPLAMAFRRVRGARERRDMQPSTPAPAAASPPQ
jgi:hypothetical protein